MATCSPGLATRMFQWNPDFLNPEGSKIEGKNVMFD